LGKGEGKKRRKERIYQMKWARRVVRENGKILFKKKRYRSEVD